MTFNKKECLDALINGLQIPDTIEPDGFLEILKGFVEEFKPRYFVDIEGQTLTVTDRSLLVVSSLYISDRKIKFKAPVSSDPFSYSEVADLFRYTKVLVDKMKVVENMSLKELDSFMRGDDKNAEEKSDNNKQKLQEADKEDEEDSEDLWL